MSMRVRCFDVFTQTNGRFTPRKTVRFEGVLMNPGISFMAVQSGDLHAALLAGRDLEIEQGPNGIVEIKRHY